MSEQLRKTKEWVSKSGYPMELEVIDTLRGSGWAVMSSANYFDEDEAKWRELDIKAYRQVELGDAVIRNWSYRLRLTLVIQCKRSEKFAWVFFPIDQKHHQKIESIDFLKVARVQSLASRDPISIRQHRILGVSRDILVEPPLIGLDTAKQIKWLSELVAFGSNDFQSFVNACTASIGTVAPLGGEGKPPNELFEAIITVTKALVYELELMSEYHHAALSLLRDHRLRRLVNKKSFLEVDIVLPVAIFEGALCLWRGKEADLEEVNHVVYAFENRSSRYFGEYTINIVRKNTFGNFLAKLNNDLENLGPKFQEKKEELDKYTRLFASSQDVNLSKE